MSIILNKKITNFIERKESLEKSYLALRERIKTSDTDDRNLETYYNLLLELDQILFDLHYEKSRLEISKTPISEKERKLLRQIDDYEAKIERMIPIPDLIAEVPEIAIIRRQIHESAVEAGKIQLQILSVNVSNKRQTKQPDGGREKRAKTTDPIINWLDSSSWSKEHVKCVFFGSRIKKNTTERVSEVQERFKQDLGLNISGKVVSYFFLHYGLRETGVYPWKINEAFDKAYMLYRDLPLGKKIDLIRTYIKNKEKYFISKNDASRGIRFRDILMEIYGMVSEPVSNYVEYFPNIQVPESNNISISNVCKSDSPSKDKKSPHATENIEDKPSDSDGNKTVLSDASNLKISPSVNDSARDKYSDPTEKFPVITEPSVATTESMTTRAPIIDHGSVLFNNSAIYKDLANAKSSVVTKVTPSKISMSAKVTNNSAKRKKEQILTSVDTNLTPTAKKPITKNIIIKDLNEGGSSSKGKKEFNSFTSSRAANDNESNPLLNIDEALKVPSLDGTASEDLSCIDEETKTNIIEDLIYQIVISQKPDEYYKRRFDNLNHSSYWTFELNKILTTSVEYLSQDQPISQTLLLFGRLNVVKLINLKIHRELNINVKSELIKNRLITMMEHDVFTSRGATLINQYIF